MKTDILDKKDKMFKTDPESMLSKIEEFPEQIKDCWDDVLKFIVPTHYLNVKNVLILGMGGSAIGGDLARSLASKDSKIPINVMRDYELPKYANKDTLVIASSYSGNTEETLTTFRKAHESGCKMLAITTGGKIKKICQKYDLPCFEIEYDSQPRAALGYSLTSILGILTKLSIYKTIDNQINKAIDDLIELNNKINIDVPINNNPAKQLAINLAEFTPLVIGSGNLAEVAHRYKTQINENAKQMANWDILPELNHNTVVGFEFPRKFNDQIYVLMLQSAYDNRRTKLRQQIMIKILSKQKIKFETLILAPSSSPLSEMLKTIFFGDYTSYYMAMLNGVDPTPVEIIKYLKDKLAEH